MLPLINTSVLLLSRRPPGPSRTPRVRDKVADDGCKIKANEIHSYLTRVMYQRRNKFNPLFNTIVVAGFSGGESFLGMVDSIGTAFTEDFVATGFGGHLAIPIMREEWRPDMSEDDARALLEKCMRVLYYRDCRTINKVRRLLCFVVLAPRDMFTKKPHEQQVLTRLETPKLTLAPSFLHLVFPVLASRCLAPRFLSFVGKMTFSTVSAGGPQVKEPEHLDTKWDYEVRFIFGSRSERSRQAIVTYPLPFPPLSSWFVFSQTTSLACIFLPAPFLAPTFSLVLLLFSSFFWSQGFVNPKAGGDTGGSW